MGYTYNVRTGDIGHEDEIALTAHMAGCPLSIIYIPPDEVDNVAKLLKKAVKEVTTSRIANLQSKRDELALRLAQIDAQLAALTQSGGTSAGVQAPAKISMKDAFIREAHSAPAEIALKDSGT